MAAPPGSIPMDKHIPIALHRTPEIVIDSAPIAQAFGLDVAAFQRLLEDRKITQLCERGTDEDAGTYRASFYLNRKRVRLLLDGEGRLLAPIETTERQ